jgi:hypothetical protein
MCCNSLRTTRSATVVHPALHQNLRAVDPDEFLDLPADRLEAQRVAVGVFMVAPERAERALGGADVRVVDVPVDDVRRWSYG